MSDDSPATERRTADLSPEFVRLLERYGAPERLTEPSEILVHQAQASARRRSARITQLLLVALVAALSATTAILINAATAADQSWPSWLDPLRSHPWLFALLLTLATAALSMLSWYWENREPPPPDDPPAPPLPAPGPWTVHRTGEVDQIVRELTRGRAGAVGITTALHGAGGFGKTTLARTVCADRRVRRHFRGIYWVTLGPEAQGWDAVVERVNDVIRAITGRPADFTDPQAAGETLGRLLDERPRSLLVVDDIWTAAQVAPFLMRGSRSARLLTTRMPEALPSGTVLVQVDAMSAAQARAVVNLDLPTLETDVADRLADAVGRWPLLLRLINSRLAAESADDVNVAAGGLLEQLQGSVHRLESPEERARAVRATIETSTAWLGAESTERLTELGIFVEDETIPIALVAALWSQTGGLGAADSDRLCRRLADLSLISINGSGLALHDVVRQYLRAELGADRIVELNASFLDAVAPETGWWKLSEEDSYLWQHLIDHLVAAGRIAEAEAVAGDLRWVTARLLRFGAPAPLDDLALVGTDRARMLGAGLARAAHLLSPTEPAYAVVDVLLSRLQDDLAWSNQVEAMRTTLARPMLVNRWSLPDLADEATYRILAGHQGGTTAVAISPDATWLATASDDRTVRIWDPATGQTRARLTGHTESVTAVAVAPGSAWLATASRDGTVRIWDPVIGRTRAVLTGHTESVTAVAVAPDSAWLATASEDQTVRIWDPATGQTRAELTGHTDWVRAVAVAPDGQWLATASD
ncbi:NB-ARC domain-containing protein, partial [Paractinoplanes rishiriensis]|uniref:NB-ARC domain-containing protein n=1 Tax=Paractinoplanes rishiriensis TaxID=1050105 RepID=UPI001EF17E56